MSEVKQLIIVRNDLRQKLRHGKLAAQVAHASMASFLQERTIAKSGFYFDSNVLTLELSADMNKWISGSFTKVVLKADDLTHLIQLEELCVQHSIPQYVITDAGRTVFKDPTVTCMGVGPFDSTTLDELFSDLKMY